MWKRVFTTLLIIEILVFTISAGQEMVPGGLKLFSPEKVILNLSQSGFL
ncbi:MAG: hypothetical protein K9K37_10605 [Desulfocapsa sp.]|nr:hypothetical protein [Desulfocapsa sp.]